MTPMLQSESETRCSSRGGICASAKFYPIHVIYEAVVVYDNDVEVNDVFVVDGDDVVDNFVAVFVVAVFVVAVTVVDVLVIEMPPMKNVRVIVSSVVEHADDDNVATDDTVAVAQTSRPSVRRLTGQPP